MDPIKVSGVNVTNYWKSIRSPVLSRVHKLLLALLTMPEHFLTSQRRAWTGSGDHMNRKSFDKLKELITTALVLAFLDGSQMYCVKADTLEVETRATISQQSPEDGNLLPEPEPSQAELQDQQQGNAGHHPYLRGVAALPGRCPAQV